MDKATEDGFERYSRASDAQFRLCALVGAIDAALEGDAQPHLLDEVMRRAVDAAAEARGNLPQVAEQVDWVTRSMSSAQLELNQQDRMHRFVDSRDRAVSALGLAALEAARAIEAMPSPSEGGADGD